MIGYRQALVSISLAMVMATTSAFVPSTQCRTWPATFGTGRQLIHHQIGSRPTTSSQKKKKIMAVSLTRARGKTALNTFVGDFFEALETLPADFDLALGMFIIFCAVTPYTLGLFLPKTLNKNFFLPVYGKDDFAGRRAEIYWKLMYATQGLVLTTLSFAEAIGHVETERALRDSYIAWALFYIAAIIKIRYEADNDIIKKNRFGIQLWHSIVVIALLVDVGCRPEVLERVAASVL